MSDTANEVGPQPASTIGIFRQAAIAASRSRRPEAVLAVSGRGLSRSFWVLIATTTAGMVAVATIHLPRTIEAVRLPDSTRETEDRRAVDTAAQCRADRGEIAVAFEPRVAAMVPPQGTVEVTTRTGWTAVAMHTPGTDPTRRCLHLGHDHSRDATAPTMLVRVRGGTGLDFILGGG